MAMVKLSILRGDTSSQMVFFFTIAIIAMLVFGGGFCFGRPSWRMGSQYGRKVMTLSDRGFSLDPIPNGRYFWLINRGHPNYLPGWWLNQPL